MTPTLVRYVNSIARSYVNRVEDREDLTQDAHVKILELRAQGIQNEFQIMRALSNMFLDKGRVYGQRKKIMDKYIKTPAVEHHESIWDEKKISIACMNLPWPQDVILANLTKPSEEYQQALRNKYLDKDYVHMDESVLAEVLGMSASTLSRAKNELLLVALRDNFHQVQATSASVVYTVEEPTTMDAETDMRFRRALVIINDPELKESDKIWRLSSICCTVVYRYLYREIFGKWVVKANNTEVKMAVLYAVLRDYTPRALLDSPWDEVRERRYQEAVTMVEQNAKESAPKVEKVPGVFGKHRDLGKGDDVAKTLATIPDVKGMVAFAKAEGLKKFQAMMGKMPETDKEKHIALQDCDGYLTLPNPGLVRMTIGNRLRGMEKALANRADKEKAKAERKAAQEKAKAEKLAQKNAQAAIAQADAANKTAPTQASAPKQAPKLKKVNG